MACKWEMYYKSVTASATNVWKAWMHAVCVLSCVKTQKNMSSTGLISISLISISNVKADEKYGDAFCFSKIKLFSRILSSGSKKVYYVFPSLFPFFISSSTKIEMVDY